MTENQDAAVIVKLAANVCARDAICDVIHGIAHEEIDKNIFLVVNVASIQ